MSRSRRGRRVGMSARCRSRICAGTSNASRSGSTSTSLRRGSAGGARTQLLSSVNALWVDLDGPSRERTPDAALYALLGRCDEAGIPAPSYVLGTGRGLAAVWLVEILPREVLPRWQALQAALVERLRPLGADPRARDVARVLRLAGTLTTAPVPARLVRCLYPEAGAPRVYGFEALCEGVLPLARPDRAPGGGLHRGDGPRPVWSAWCAPAGRTRSCGRIVCRISTGSSICGGSECSRPAIGTCGCSSPRLRSPR